MYADVSVFLQRCLIAERRLLSPWLSSGLEVARFYWEREKEPPTPRYILPIGSFLLLEIFIDV
jgi:hypothetical protein